MGNVNLFDSVVAEGRLRWALDQPHVDDEELQVMLMLVHAAEVGLRQMPHEKQQRAWDYVDTRVRHLIAQRQE